MFGYCTAMGTGGWLLMIGLWGAFLALVVWLVTRIFPSDRRPDAAEVLDRRLAAGEIAPDVYREAKHEISGSGRY